MTAKYDKVKTVCSLEGATEDLLLPPQRACTQKEKEKQKESEATAPKKNDLEFDPMLVYFYNLNFGNAQFYVYFLAWLAAFISAPVYVDSNFLIRRVQHRCKVPQCDDDQSSYNESFLPFSIPHNGKDEYNECSMYSSFETADNSSCLADDFSTNVTECSEWVYDRELFSSTTVTEFDLVCDREWYGPLAGSMYMVGMLLGAITIGDFADRFGRKFGILVSVVLLGGGGVLSAVSPNYIMFLIMRIFTGAGGVGLFQVTFVLAVEFIGAKYRTFCGIIIEVPFALGEAMTGVLAIFIRDWRWLQVAITAPAFLLVSYMWLMPESIRWLVSQGRRAEAIKIIEKAARINGADVPKHLLEETGEVPTVDGAISVASSKAELVTDVPAPKHKKSVLDLLKKPNMRKRSFNMFFCWAVCTLVYYGLSSNSGNLGGNIFVNFILTMLIEIPSYVFSYLVLDRMGRKGTLSFVLLLGGVACFVSGFIPEGKTLWARAVLHAVAHTTLPTQSKYGGVGKKSIEIFP